MPGKYNNAPLVYVTASIRTSALPRFTRDQIATVEQTLIKRGFVHSAVGISTKYSFNQLISTGDEEKRSESEISHELERKGYFTQDRKTCLIIGRHGLEWRTSEYVDYETFHASFSDLTGALISVVDSLGDLITEELTLSYSDVIAPIADRKLADYFVKDNEILPLSFFDGFPDIQQIGALQVTRIAQPTEKIQILLEQLPTSDGRLLKLLPDALLEPNNDFGMPLAVKAEWAEPVPDRKEYALLLTQASSLVSATLKEYAETDLFESIHKLTSETFKSLLNHEICDLDWEMTDVSETS